jgi:hypothetical protein
VVLASFGLSYVSLRNRVLPLRETVPVIKLHSEDIIGHKDKIPRILNLIFSLSSALASHSGHITPKKVLVSKFAVQFFKLPRPDNDVMDLLSSTIQHCETEGFKSLKC